MKLPGLAGPGGTLQGLDGLTKARLDTMKSTLNKVRESAKDSEQPQVKKEEDIEKAATDFEALMLSQMLKSMWKSVESSGLLSGSREESMYRDMLNDSLAKDISNGQGIGIKEVIVRDLKKYG